MMGIKNDIEQKIIHEFNNTKVAYPAEKTITQLFEEQAERTPCKTALVFENERINYNELNKKINQLAHVLIDLGIKPGDPVGALFERSVEMVIAIWGILKAGGVYIPLDVDYPLQRLEYIIEDSGLLFVLSQEKFLNYFQGKVRILDVKSLLKISENNNKLPDVITSKDLAYMIYTSGSTGKPKGVMVHHQAVNNFLTAITEVIKLDENTVMLAVTTISFDISVLEILLPLMRGAVVVIANTDQQKNPEALGELIIKENISIFQLTPSRLKMIMYTENYSSYLQTPDYILVGGEPFPEHLLKQLQQLTRAKIMNMYGPTETTVWSAIADLSDKREIVIGKPLANTQIYILDEDRNILPLEEQGEIFIAGDGVTRGYFNRPELTAERFLDNPFIAGSTMYKTGDIGCWLPDGNIKFFCRSDDQVKIRGYRIELGEIEAILSKYELVKEAAVISKQDSLGNASIIAYYILYPQNSIAISDLREYLSGFLPDYMIPAYFVEIDKMPSTPNGKLDKKALPDIKNPGTSSQHYTPPRNETERKMLQLWQSVLLSERIGIDDDYFSMGGNSLYAMMLVNNINREFRINISITDFFKFSTVKKLCRHIVEIQPGEFQVITPAPPLEYYPLSGAQKRIYMHQLLDRKGTGYNLPVVYEIKGYVHLQKINEAVNEIIERHESLRTSFHIVDDTVMQKIHQTVSLKINFRETDHESLNSLFDYFNRPFDLSTAPLLRMGLIETSKEEYYLIINMHHIIGDGVSIDIMISELSSLYSGRKLSPLQVQYKDYIYWHSSLTGSDVIARQKEFWLNEYGDNFSYLNLPLDFQRPAEKSFEGDVIWFDLDVELTKKLIELASLSHGTLYMLLLGSFILFLSKYSNQSDVIIGTNTAGRGHAEIQNLIGMFVNTVPVRNWVDPEQNFNHFLAQVKSKVLQTFENENFQFEELISLLNLQGNSSYNPLFEVVFLMQHINVELEFPSARTSLLNYNPKTIQFDLILEVFEINGTISLGFRYGIRSFKKSTIEKFCHCYINILKEIVKNPESQIKRINMLSDEEKQRILVDFNRTKASYPDKKTIVELFEVQVEKTPAGPAVEFDDYRLTYAELNKKANQMARVFREKGIQKGEKAAVILDRSVEMIVAILGIMKAGGAYIPVEPFYPVERINYILDDSEAALLVISRGHLQEGMVFDKSIIFAEDFLHLSQGADDNPPPASGPGDLIYIIYTSGTTGKPKGVMIEHRNAVNYTTWAAGYYLKHDVSTFPLFTSVAFDLTVTSLFVPLLTGNKMIIYQDVSIEEIVEINHVDIIKLTPSHLKMLRGKEYKNSRIKSFIVGGEELTTELAREIYKNFDGKIKIYNEYGPTETTVGCMIHEFDLSYDIKNAVSIGKPSSNVQLYILDRYKNPLPIGAKGELYISGDGVARGYLNKKQLNKIKYLQNPFDNKKRMYKSGDLASWNVDGNIDFHGRIDHQVKIRGVRIELGEIESRLETHERINSVVVVSKKDQYDTSFLCAYYTGNEAIQIAELKKHLAQTLPDYMIPAFFVHLSDIKLTTNGKVDQKQLPDPFDMIDPGDYRAPENETQEGLVSVWQNTLSVMKIGINSNFFDLGGNSLNGITLISRINRKFMVNLAFLDLLKHPTIKSLSELILCSGRSEGIIIRPCKESEFYRVSYAQKGFYILDQIGNKGTGLNSAVAYLIRGAIDVEKLGRVLEKLIIRHRALRTSFVIRNNELFQRIHERVDVSFIRDEVFSAVELDLNAGQFIKPYDLGTPPLARFALIDLKEECEKLGKHLFILDMHHIISDGISMNIFIKELCDLYNNRELDDIAVHYNDFSVWQNDFLATESGIKQEEFWRDHLSGKNGSLNILLDYPRSGRNDFSARTISRELNPELCNRLYNMASEFTVTPFMILLSFYYILLAKYTGQDDIVIGVVVAGRPYLEIQNTIGLFTNTLPIKNTPHPSKTYSAFLDEVKQTILKGFQHQDYPFDKILEDLSIVRDGRENPLFDTMFALLNTASGKEITVNGEVVFQPYHIQDTQLGVDTFLEILEFEDGLTLNFQYSPVLFKESTIDGLLDNYIKIAGQLTKNKNMPLADIEVPINDLAAVTTNLSNLDFDF